MNKPKVSVIVPVYNTEKYLRKCVESLVNQTLEDIEIVMINDGSKDSSESIIKEYMEKYPDSLMWKISDSLDKVNGLTSFEAMRKGDEAAQKVVDEYLYAVAAGIIDMINIFQPEIICICGGISKEGSYLLDPIKKYVEEEAYAPDVPAKPVLKIAQLGNDAGIIGAALLGT